MAESFSHSWGQKIGEVLEQVVLGLLSKFARDHHLYLDQKGTRPARPGKNASWLDINGNKHDLDYVLEKGGTPKKIGVPVAFIETAWRRYTKHSKNKAQEIQGAIMPLVEHHRKSAPFKGAILAGEFTDNSLTQLTSLGFSVLFIPYDVIIDVFAHFGIDAAFDETTKELAFKRKLDKWALLKPIDKAKLCKMILDRRKGDVNEFIKKLSLSVLRTVTAVYVMPLHGVGNTLPTVQAAVTFITNHNEEAAGLPIAKYIVQIRYSTGDKIEGEFASKDGAIEFLRGYLPPTITPAA